MVFSVTTIILRLATHLQGSPGGLRERLEKGLLSLVRDAITARRKIEFDYLSRGTGRRRRRRVRRYGVLYGNRAFLVGRTDRGKDPMLWRLANVTPGQEH